MSRPSVSVEAEGVVPVDDPSRAHRRGRERETGEDMGSHEYVNLYNDAYLRAYVFIINIYKVACTYNIHTNIHIYT